MMESHKHTIRTRKPAAVDIIHMTEKFLALLVALLLLSSVSFAEVATEQDEETEQVSALRMSLRTKLLDEGNNDWDVPDDLEDRNASTQCQGLREHCLVDDMCCGSMTCNWKHFDFKCYPFPRDAGQPCYENSIGYAPCKDGLICSFWICRNPKPGNQEYCSILFPCVPKPGENLYCDYSYPRSGPFDGICTRRYEWTFVARVRSNFNLFDSSVMCYIIVYSWYPRCPSLATLILSTCTTAAPIDFEIIDMSLQVAAQLNAINLQDFSSFWKNIAILGLVLVATSCSLTVVLLRLTYSYVKCWSN